MKFKNKKCWFCSKEAKCNKKGHAGLLIMSKKKYFLCPECDKKFLQFLEWKSIDISKKYFMIPKDWRKRFKNKE